MSSLQKYYSGEDLRKTYQCVRAFYSRLGRKLSKSPGNRELMNRDQRTFDVLGMHLACVGDGTDARLQHAREWLENVRLRFVPGTGIGLEPELYALIEFISDLPEQEALPIQLEARDVLIDIGLPYNPDALRTLVSWAEAQILSYRAIGRELKAAMAAHRVANLYRMAGTIKTAYGVGPWPQEFCFRRGIQLTETAEKILVCRFRGRSKSDLLSQVLLQILFTRVRLASAEHECKKAEDAQLAIRAIARETGDPADEFDRLRGEALCNLMRRRDTSCKPEKARLLAAAEKACEDAENIRKALLGDQPYSIDSLENRRLTIYNCQEDEGKLRQALEMRAEVWAKDPQVFQPACLRRLLEDSKIPLPPLPPLSSRRCSMRTSRFYKIPGLMTAN